MQTRKERRLLAREHHREEVRATVRKSQWWRWLKRGLLAAVIALSAWWALTPSGPEDPLDRVIAQNGLHWHADLALTINGQKQNIPSGIGIGAVHQPIHTHDEKDIIHMEFPGRVRARDLELGEFFRNWGRPFPAGPSLKMRVNGSDNREFERYQMRDGDKIEITS